MGDTETRTEMKTEGEKKQKKPAYRLWIRLLSALLAIVLVIELTSIDFSMLQYSGKELLAAQYLLSATSYMQENRAQRLKSLLLSLTPFETHLNAAEIAIARTDYKRAATFLLDALAQQKDPALKTELYNRLGCVYMMEALSQQAQDSFDNSIALSPQDPTAYVLRSQLRYQEGDLPGAIQDAKDYIALGGEDADMLQAAEVLCELGSEWESASLAFERLVKNAQDPSEIALYRAEWGRVQYLMGESQQADKNIRSARNTDPSALTAVHYAIIALYSFENEDYQQSKTDFLQAAKLSEGDCQQYYEQAILCDYLLEDYASLLLTCKEAESKKAMSALAYLLQGVSLFLGGEFESAILALTSSIQKGEIVPEVYYYRGLTYLALSQYENAISDFTLSIEREENKLECVYNRGVCYYALGDYGQAQTDFLFVIDDNSQIELITSARELLDSMEE